MGRLPLLLLAITACSASPDQDAIDRPLTDVAGNPADGRRIFIAREAGHCVLCHQVAGLEAPFQGNLGPALDGIGSRLSPGQIRMRVVDNSRLNPDTIMPSYYRTEGLAQVGKKFQGEPVLSAQQVEHLVAWLASLKEQGADEL